MENCVKVGMKQNSTGPRGTLENNLTQWKVLETFFLVCETIPFSKTQRNKILNRLSLQINKQTNCPILAIKLWDCIKNYRAEKNLGSYLPQVSYIPKEESEKEKVECIF